MFETTTGQVPSAQNEGTPKKKSAVLAGVLLLAVIVLAGAWFFFNRGVKGGVAEEGTSRTVAMVNGAVVTRADLDKKLEQVRAASPTTANAGEDAGFELQVLDELINLRLLVMLAEERGMTVTEEAVKSEIDGLVKAFGGPDVLAERLNQAKLTEEELNENIRNEILVRQLVDADTDIELATTTAAEVRAKYDEILAANQGGEFPPFEQVSEMIRAQLLQEKSATVVQDYITTARAKADIQVLL